MVLHAVSRPPFEPLQQIELRKLSFKTALLLALTSAKRVSDIHAHIGVYAVFTGELKGFVEAESCSCSQGV